MRVLREKEMIGVLRRLHREGKPFFGTSAGSIMLASQWIRWADPNDEASAELFDCLGLAPVFCDTHGEDDGWEELQALLRSLSDWHDRPWHRLGSWTHRQAGWHCFRNGWRGASVPKAGQRGRPDRKPIPGQKRRLKGVEENSLRAVAQMHPSESETRLSSTCLKGARVTIIF